MGKREAATTARGPLLQPQLGQPGRRQGGGALVRLGIGLLSAQRLVCMRAKCRSVSVAAFVLSLPWTRSWGHPGSNVGLDGRDAVAFLGTQALRAQREPPRCLELRKRKGLVLVRLWQKAGRRRPASAGLLQRPPRVLQLRGAGQGGNFGVKDTYKRRACEPSRIHYLLASACPHCPCQSASQTHKDPATNADPI